MGQVPSHSVISFGSKEERKEFCEGAAVWWYQFAEEIEFGRSGGAIGQPRQQNVGVRVSGWIKGGAWAAAEAEQAHEDKIINMDERGDLW